MANITKQKREQMIAFLKGLKAVHNDDASVRAFNEIENHLKDKKFGIFTRVPERSEVVIPVEERYIVELYSK